MKKERNYEVTFSNGGTMFYYWQTRSNVMESALTHCAIYGLTIEQVKAV